MSASLPTARILIDRASPQGGRIGFELIRERSVLGKSERFDVATPAFGQVGDDRFADGRSGGADRLQETDWFRAGSYGRFRSARSREKRARLSWLANRLTKILAEIRKLKTT